jgi:RimJ/RimL family protein N-acetyltransferase
MESKAILRPEDIALLGSEILNDAGRFGVFIAQDKDDNEVGVIVLHRSRDNEHHGYIEMAWMDKSAHADGKILDDTRRAVLTWAKANKLKSMGAMTMRDTPAMEKLAAALGFHKTSCVYYGMHVTEAK